MRFQYAIALLIVGACPVFGSGCSLPPKRFDLQDVQAIVPIGTNKPVAIGAMERAGFHCETRLDADFEAFESNSARQSVEVRNIDFIDCSIVWEDHFVTTIYHVALVLDDDDNVSEILEHWDCLGP